MTVPLGTYDNRINAMLKEAVPGSHQVADWTSGKTNVDWWSLRTPVQDLVRQDGYNARLWRITYEAIYIVGNMAAGDKGPTRLKVLELLPQIKEYFQVHASMKTSTTGQTAQIAGFVSGSFRDKYDGERVISNKNGDMRGMMFTITFNHRESIQIKET